MEVGDPGVLILPAAGLVVEAPSQNLEIVTTQNRHMEGPGARDHPFRARAATPSSVDQAAC